MASRARCSIGCDKASAIAYKADDEGIMLREVALARAYGAGVTSCVSCVCTDADSAVIHETGLKPA